MNPSLWPPDDVGGENLVARTFDAFPGRVAVACSFGGTGGMVLLDMALRLDPTVPVLVLDTGLLFAETYALIDRVEARYGIQVTRVSPLRTVDEQAADHGPALWSRDPDACCNFRKVLPMRDALAGYDAWMTAVRRDQASTRAATPFVGWDDANGLWKVCPLADWDESRVRQYVREHDVPLNPLLDEGYPSLGCTVCTRKPDPDADTRAGRWAGTGKIECGLHNRPALQSRPVAVGIRK